MIGMQKAGTSWFYKQLSEHPQITMSTEKEVHYWDMNAGRGSEWYEAQFPPPPLGDVGSSRLSIAGEVTPDYLNLPMPLVARVAEYNPRMKILLCFRDEIDRVWSSFMM